MFIFVYYYVICLHCELSFDKILIAFQIYRFVLLSFIVPVMNTFSIQMELCVTVTGHICMGGKTKPCLHLVRTNKSKFIHITPYNIPFQPIRNYNTATALPLCHLLKSIDRTVQVLFTQTRYVPLVLYPYLVYGFSPPFSQSPFHLSYELS